MRPHLAACPVGLLVHYSQAARDLKDWRAVIAFQRVLTHLNPDDIKFWIFLVIALKNDGQFEEAARIQEYEIDRCRRIKRSSIQEVNDPSSGQTSRGSLLIPEVPWPSTLEAYAALTDDNLRQQSRDYLKMLHARAVRADFLEQALRIQRILVEKKPLAPLSWSWLATDLIALGTRDNDPAMLQEAFEILKGDVLRNLGAEDPLQDIVVKLRRRLQEALDPMLTTESAHVPSSDSPVIVVRRSLPSAEPRLFASTIARSITPRSEESSPSAAPPLEPPPPPARSTPTPPPPAPLPPEPPPLELPLDPPREKTPEEEIAELSDWPSLLGWLERTPRRQGWNEVHGPNLPGESWFQVPESCRETLREAVQKLGEQYESICKNRIGKAQKRVKVRKKGGEESSPSQDDDRLQRFDKNFKALQAHLSQGAININALKTLSGATRALLDFWNMVQRERSAGESD